MVRNTDCSKTFDNLRNLKRHQNKKHRRREKVEMSYQRRGIFIQNGVSYLAFANIAWTNCRGRERNNKKDSCRGEEAIGD